MKDFIKWLGVNEKIAKVVVWIFIIMVFLIVTNTMLESLGVPYYKITYENIKQINYPLVLEYAVSITVTILNFYCIMLLIFRVKETKKLLKYSILYLVLNWITSTISDSGILQIFIITYCIVFCYLYSGKNKKYILYGILSIIFNVLVQGIWYMSKARYIDYSKLDQVSKSLLSIDYFIIMAVIILVKEIYLKKRSEKDGRISLEPILDRRFQKRKPIRKENGKKSGKSTKIVKQ